MAVKKRLNMRKRYELLTRGLAWEPSYQPREKVFPYEDFEGIKITDWDKWEDPFRLTADSYWKYQAEKDKKLYAVMDSFAQNDGFLNVSDASYINALKIFIQGVSPLEYQAHRGFAHLARQFAGEGAQIACQMQSIDELRHIQTQIHTISNYNKYFTGMHDPFHMHDRVWYLSVPKSFMDDARTAGPFEFITSISFSFEYLLTNLLFVPFMSGAAHNGDMSTVTFGFSAQSDESRHMTLGLGIIKFLLEQHEDNVPIVQKWMDKHFWRSYRLLGIVSAMQDYMLTESPLSWKEGWKIYFEDNAGALFNDLSRYGIKMPKFHEVATAEADHLSHQVYSVFYAFSHAAGFQTTVPSAKKMDWLSEKYPDTFDKYYRPRWEMWAEMEKEGKRFFNGGLPLDCQVCQIPMVFTDVVNGNPMKPTHRVSEYKGDKYHTCSDGCRDIFENEPEKYVQALVPPQQIFQGNCGGETIPDVLNWYHFAADDGGEYHGSTDEKNWKKWHGEQSDSGSQEKA
ncbi:MAG: phenol 2-monooxygenase [Gammaproteobacteria bacterium]|nr:MAG: phenol 2-monooxygenase [Gammaproteobacteria bacterium]RLA24494.1 MAG: phenol 2-monooxygenase [Gammaproteobacteria bacterium]